MSKLLSFVLVCVAVLAAGTANAGNTLQGDVQVDPNSNPSERATDLFQGDLGSERGIGCSNSAGRSGGPNDVAVRVTSPLPLPFCITSHYYDKFSEDSPTITALNFSVWAGGAVPGVVLGQQPGMDFSPGEHTAAISPPIVVNSAQFFFGQVQPQTDAGTRWGADTSSGGNGTSFIKAPNCGVSSWVTLTSIGFSGNWVMSVSVESCVVPLELQTWGGIKSSWQ